ncbi:MAG: hypothetical protein ACODAQ_12640 [Phycisphaeraceae bacterium]
MTTTTSSRFAERIGVMGEDRASEIGIAIARFFFGAVLGAFLVLLVWMMAWFSHATIFLTVMGVAALVCGLLGLFIGDYFIDGFRNIVGQVTDGLAGWWW